MSKRVMRDGVRKVEGKVQGWRKTKWLSRSLWFCRVCGKRYPPWFFDECEPTPDDGVEYCVCVPPGDIEGAERLMYGLDDETESECACPHCGSHMVRVVKDAEIKGHPDE